MTALTAPVPTDVDLWSARRAGQRQGTVPRTHLLATTPIETRTSG